MNHTVNYLKKLTIENFQSHVKTTIEPAPPGQLTVITGPSDSGKTAVLRAGRWVFNNQPQGADFIRVGASFARTTVDYASGHTVIRERTKATNRYKIVAPGADGAKTGPQVFEGFGSSVPLEVQEITGVKPVKIGDLELNLNLVGQLDGPFLGSSISGGARAKVLGKLAGTEEIDYAAKQLGTDLYRRNQDEKRLAGEVAELEEKIREYGWLPAVKAKIEALERLAAKVKAAQERRAVLVGLKARLGDVNEKITSCHAALYRWRNLGQAEELAINIAENQRGKEVLSKLVGNYWMLEKSIWACEKIVAKHATLPEAERMLQAAQEGVERAGKLSRLKDSYAAGREIIRKNQEILSNLEGLDAAEELLWSLNARKQRKERLDDLKIKWTAKSNLVTAEREKLQYWAGIEKAEKMLSGAQANHEQRNKLVSLRAYEKSFFEDVQRARGQVVMWENRVAELEGAYHDLLESAGVCPLCGATLIGMKIKEVI